MYPFIRLLKDMALSRNAPPLGLSETHVSQHICWPWDLDPWVELNNGRTLTLYDLGRIPLIKRTGLVRVLSDKTWGLTVAGASVRYRRRVRAFDRITMRSRFVCWDEKFTYIEQTMSVRAEVASHVLLRIAATDANGIVASERVLAALGAEQNPPRDIPDWIAAWIEAEALRPWPPDLGD